MGLKKTKNKLVLHLQKYSIVSQLRTLAQFSDTLQGMKPTKQYSLQLGLLFRDLLKIGGERVGGIWFELNRPRDYGRRKFESADIPTNIAFTPKHLPVNRREFKV